MRRWDSLHRVFPEGEAWWRRPPSLLVGVGMLAGLLAWVYDHDFFLNPGGPDTAISDAILRVTGMGHGSPVVLVFLPAAVMIIAGMGAGFLLTWVSAVIGRARACSRARRRAR